MRSTKPSASLIRKCSETDFHHLLIRANGNTDAKAWMMAERCRDRPEFLARAVLADVFRLPFAKSHEQLFHWHHRMLQESLQKRNRRRSEKSKAERGTESASGSGEMKTTRDGRRYVLAAPRGSAKSTIVSYLLVLHDLLFEQERYIVLISATQRQAEQRLRAIRRTLETHQVLRRIFQERLKNTELSWTKNILTFGDIRIEALGAGSEMRGISHDGWRPTKIILDDAEKSVAATSPKYRLSLREWFSEVVENLGHPYTHLLAVGTILHRESLLSWLLQRSDFTGMLIRSVEQFAPDSDRWQQWRVLATDMTDAERRQKARNYFELYRREMEEGAIVNWPAAEDYEQLKFQLLTQGRRSFWQEKQNEPLGHDDSLFSVEEVWKTEAQKNGWRLRPPESMEHAERGRSYDRDDLEFFAHLDSALGKSGRRKGDFAAIAIVALADDGMLLLVDLWAKRTTPSEQVRVLWDLHEEYRFTTVSIEGTGFQSLLTEPIREEEKRRKAFWPEAKMNLEVTNPRLKKEMRIARLEPLLSSGRLALDEKLPSEFWRELSGFPHVVHDDALDATDAAVQLAVSKNQNRERRLDGRISTLKRKRQGRVL